MISGTYVDADTYDIDRTLRGRAGNIRITVDGQAYWEIIGGTEAYAGLHGQGQEAGLYTTNTTDITMCNCLGRPGRIEPSRSTSAADRRCTRRFPSLG